ncbi:choice-of-anchor Q domain-containing protein [Solirubrobacter deserti]|uniref:Ig-like domain-containing protein n=1 Tax=Solirubrobacter deserti TaxID=2282478 RepID=A0ABT4RK80_9ACTN|nr:Ig-like domain-containing protein [Solirubrobacter deserti]MDA0138971.1 Ig-like domain-containing protein [Solirubrobacter deserti]
MRRTWMLLAMVAALVCAPAAQAAEFEVNSTGDGADASCPTTCTLRAAIAAADAAPNPDPEIPDTITVPTGTYQLTQGALRLTTPVAVTGAGAAATQIVARASGGARVVEVVSTSATLTGIALQGGTALGPNGPHGGALMAQSSTVVLNRVHVSGGSALSGGGIANRNGTMTIQHSSIEGNRASQGGGDGGGIINFGGDGGAPAHLLVRESTIAFNTARLAGGLISYPNPADSVTLEGVTIARNQGGDRGTGGVRIDTPWQAKFTVIADNVAQGLPSGCTGVPAISQGWNVESGNECGFAQEVDHRYADAKLAGALDLWGGTTPSLRPASDSPAVDIAMPGSDCAPTDQRGFQRPQGLICDAGAFELDYWARVTAGPRGAITEARPEFEFRSARGATSFECRFEAAADWAPCSSPHRPATALRDGDYAFSVRAVGQTETAERAFTVDSVAPVVTITSGPAATNAQEAEFAFTASEPVAEYHCRVLTPDNGDLPFLPCTSPYRVDGLATGRHEFQVQATDAAGSDSETATREFVVDRTPPAMPVILQPANESYTSATSLQLSGTAEPGVTLPISLGPELLATAEADAQGAWTATVDIPEGDLVLQVPAVDAAGNRSDPNYLVVHADRTAPETRIDTAPTDPTNDANPLFTYSTLEPGSTFTCWLTGPGVTETEHPCSADGHPYNGLQNGRYTFHVRARDRAGNVDQSAESHTFTINADLPAVPVVTTPQGQVSYSNGTVTFRGTGANGTTVYAATSTNVFGGTAVIDGEWHIEFEADPGDYAFSIYATNAAGQSAGVARRIIVDKTPPTVALAAPPRYTGSSGILFAPASPDPEARLECTLNGNTASCTDTYDLIVGQTYTWALRAVDRAGNSSAPVGRTFIYRGPFQTTVKWDTPASDNTPAFTLTGGTQYTCWIDDVAVPCGPAFTAPALSDGNHTLRVRGADASGIEEEEERTFAFDIDTVDPAPPTIDSPPSGTEVTTPEITLEGTTERLSEVEIFDGTTLVGRARIVNEGSGEWFLDVSLTPGAHTFTAVTVDDAGNRSAPSAPVTVTYRAAATTIVSGPPAVTRETTAAFTFASEFPNPRFTCALDGDPEFTDCPAAYENLAEGPHELKVVAVDPDGRRGAVATHVWRVDRTPPAATAVTAGEPGVFTFAADEPGVTYACSLDDGAFEPCASPQTYAGLAPGAHTFRLRTVDAAGNATDSPATTFAVAAVAAQTQTPTPTPAPSAAPVTPTATPTPQPEAGETVVSRPVSGRILVKLPGFPSFVELRSIDDIPLGSEIDARNGRVQLRFESEPGKVQIALFYGGIFQVTQRGKVLDLKLTEELAPCPKKKGRASAAQKKASKRKLWGDGKGAFRTSGKYSAATVRGTKWLVEDSCAGTLTRVTSGVVAVRDRKKTVLVRAGRKYLAKAR